MVSFFESVFADHSKDPPGGRAYVSLSSFLCKGSVSVGWFGRLEVGVDAVGVGDGELGEGFLPVGDD
ncbi:hypothetical protein, partial [Saccharomonospora sp.]|uniref:hypothetical protein n=1 Tax=Saccharomonospora sp. TaxID=33913 RepID=UPI002637C4B5